MPLRCKECRKFVPADHLDEFPSHTVTPTGKQNGHEDGKTLQNPRPGYSMVKPLQVPEQQFNQKEAARQRIIRQRMARVAHVSEETINEWFDRLDSILHEG